MRTSLAPPLEGKVAIVTGASRGIGRGVALVLAAAGARVAITHLPAPGDVAAAQAVAAEMEGAASLHPLRLPDPASIVACVQACLAHHGRLDILVNNAGVMQRGAGLATTVEDFDLCGDVNLKGAWAMTQACIPSLKKGGDGRIVNISSGAGRRGSGNLPAYCASKAALISLTQSLAGALAPSGVTVNAVCPGVVLTPMAESFAKITPFPGRRQSDDAVAMVEWCLNEIPLGRMQTAADVGHAVAFFASPAARNITGQALNVDGGLMMN